MSVDFAALQRDEMDFRAQLGAEVWDFYPKSVSAVVKALRAAKFARLAAWVAAHPWERGTIADEDAIGSALRWAAREAAGAVPRARKLSPAQRALLDELNALETHIDDEESPLPCKAHELASFAAFGGWKRAAAFIDEHLAKRTIRSLAVVFEAFDEGVASRTPARPPGVAASARATPKTAPKTKAKAKTAPKTKAKAKAKAGAKARAAPGAKARAARASLPTIEPMLATLAEAPFHRRGWVYEEKYDGYRFVAYKQGARVRLLTRRGNDRAKDFPELARALAALAAPTLVLDGEAVIFDARGVSRFQLLQRREIDATQAAAVFVAFDCLYARGRDLRGEPLSARRRTLLQEVRGAARVRASVRLASNGLVAFEKARARGGEGVMAKRAASVYRSGERSDDWLKVKVRREDEFVIAGYTAPQGKRTHLGALLLGYYDGAVLRYAGKAGTGYTAEILAELSARFAPLVRARSPFADEVREREVTWLAPKLVGQFAYAEMTREGRVRQAAFLGLRDDKRPKAVHRPGG